LFSVHVLLASHEVDCNGVERGLDVRRRVFHHFDTGAAILSDLVNVRNPPRGAGRCRYAAGCRRYGIGLRGRNEALFVEDGFEKLALPLWKIRSVGSGVRPRCPKTAEVSDMLVGMYTP
jgi:hypothetical protein